jgi:hypothetical protein
MSKRISCLASCLIVAFTVAPGSGATAMTQAPASTGGLAEAKALRCSFTRQGAGTWRKDTAIDVSSRSATLALRFDSIDADAGTAQLRNGAVGSEVILRVVPGYVHFMQAFRTGPLYTTTVFEAGATGGRFKAVHSRHEYFTTPLPGATSTPEQYYGDCEIVR